MMQKTKYKLMGLSTSLAFREKLLRLAWSYKKDVFMYSDHAGKIGRAENEGNGVALLSLCLQKEGADNSIYEALFSSVKTTDSSIKVTWNADLSVSQTDVIISIYREMVSDFSADLAYLILTSKKTATGEIHLEFSPEEIRGFGNIGRKYRQFSELNRNVLTPSIKDLKLLGIDMSLDFEKQGVRYSKIKIKAKPDEGNNY